MKRKFIGKRLLATALVAVAGVTLLAGCGKKSGSDAASASGSDSSKVTTVRVGTGNAYSPYCYLDANGKLAGYEYEVLKAVDSLLPQYKFTYQTSDFQNVLISLDAGKIDLAAHQYEWNKERDEKYLFGKETYTTYVTYIVVPGNNTTIDSLDDLQGKTVKSSTGSNATYILQNYNKTHKDNPIKIENVDNGTNEETYTGLTNGKWDATILTQRDVDTINKAYAKGSDKLKTVGKAVQTSGTYFIFAKTNTKLQTAVDGAVKKLKENGELAKISEKVLGGNYTK